MHFFILVFSDCFFSQLFFSCALLSLSSTFCLSLLSFFAYPLLSLSVFLVCLLLSFLLPSIFLYFLCLSSKFSFSYYLFLSSTFLLGFLLLSFFDCLLLYFPYSSLYPFANLSVFIIIIFIIIELTHCKTILEITVEIKPQPAALDFKNLSQYSCRSK